MGKNPDQTGLMEGLDPTLPAPAVDHSARDAEERKWTPAKIGLWVAISLLGAVAWFMLALVRGETVNAIWFVFAAVCTYLIGYRFYSKVIERYLLKPDDRRATPAEYKADGKDFVATDRQGSFEISARGKPTYSLIVDQPGFASAFVNLGGRNVSLPGMYVRSSDDGACWNNPETSTRICAW